MALPQNTKDEEYDRKLRQLMQECLPGILADIVEQRPPDPILYLAQCLYTYMGKELPAQYKNLPTGIKVTTDGMSLPQTSGLYHTVGKTSAVDQDEAMDYIDEVAAAGITNTMVHEQMSTVFITIGDVFDDEDIS